jgi:hypothetical protein
MSVYRVGGNKSSQNVFPSVRPTLDLDFANSKTLDPRITFTRSSGGSYVGADGLIRYAGVNEARFDHDPSTGESLGLLIEESRTNLVNNSLNGYINNFPSTATITTGIDAPDGTNTAIRFSCNNTGSSLLRVNTATLSNDVVYSASFYVRYISGNTTSGSSPALTADICDGASINYLPLLIKDKWVKITFSGIRALTDFPQFNFLDLLSDRTNNYILDFWGAQVEQGAFPTSYIPTQGSTRTRAADNASITGNNFSEWYRQDEGTLFSDSQRPILPTASEFSQVFFMSDGTNNNTINLAYITSTLSQLRIRRLAFNEANMTPPTAALRRITAGAYAVNNAAVSEAGAAALVDTSVVLPSNLTQLNIGTAHNGTGPLNGTISRLTYFPKRLPNEQLIALTR